MLSKEQFQAALALPQPWVVDRTEFVAKAKHLDIYLDFPRGARFPCLEGDETDCGVHEPTTRPGDT